MAFRERIVMYKSIHDRIDIQCDVNVYHSLGDTRYLQIPGHQQYDGPLFFLEEIYDVVDVFSETSRSTSGEIAWSCDGILYDSSSELTFENEVVFYIAPFAYFDCLEDIASGGI